MNHDTQRSTFPSTARAFLARRTLTLAACALFVALALAACGGKSDAKKPAEKPAETPLLRMLRFIPDTPEYRALVTFGDAQAWHTSWSIPRIDNMEQLNEMEREPRAYWLQIMSRQTTPPDSLGWQYLTSEDQRGAYGFDLFSLDRYLYAGQPPDEITVAEFVFDGAQIGQALTASGYTTQALEAGGTLYSLHGDYEVDLQSPTRSGRVGNLNRVALLDGQLVIAKATANVNKALSAHGGQLRSLADNSDFSAAATALQDPALAETGELVGAILMETGAQFAGSDFFLGGAANAEAMEQFERQFAELPPLPSHKLAAFATRHSAGGSSLILAVVFPSGTDAQAAADVLAGRLKSYVSLRFGGPLDERWTFQTSKGVDVAGTPVALVVMRADDPPPTPADAPIVNTYVFSWVELVYARDLGFLMIGPTAE
jgi:hypothetical protein